MNQTSESQSSIIAADELRAFLERYEQLDAEKKDVADQQKELVKELKGRGYAAKPFKAIVALRKMKPDDLAEQESILELYRQAVGM
jgi:uncharacterized protein (UPF0335 family)